MAEIHPSSDVKSTHIGKGTRVWQYCVVFPEAVIGDNCNICAHVLIENDVEIGNNVTIKSGVQVWDGVRIENDAFIGPNVTFTNDLTPRSKKYPNTFLETIVKQGASIGANATIVGGHTIGEYAFVGSGSVVTQNIPPYTLWYGNPARQKGYVTKEGILLDMDKRDKCGKQYSI